MQAALDLFYLYQDDGWDRNSLLTAMVFNTTRTERGQCKEPDHFNATLLRGESDEDDETDEDLAWIDEAIAKTPDQPASCNNGEQIIN